MASTAKQLSAEAYLRSLEKLLRDAPRGMGAELLEDVAQHIEDGRSRGRNDDQIISALGSPEAVAAPLMAELAAPEERAHLRRNSLVLGAVALILGVFVSIIDSPLADSFGELIFGASVPESEGGSYGSVYVHGALQLLIFAIFGVGVAATAVMKGKAAQIYGYVAAVCMTFLVVGFIASSGIFYIPSMATAWMLVGVNGRSSSPVNRERRSKLIRIIGGIAILLPVVLLAAGLFTSFEQNVSAYLCLALGLACGVGFLANSRIALWASCASGAVLLAVSVVDQGLLLAAFWLAGTAYFFFGLYGLMWFKRRGRARG